MSTDFPDSTGPTPAPDRRPSRAGEGGAPVTGVLAIVLAVIAVVAGFLILRSISGDDDAGDGALTPGVPSNTTDPPDEDPDPITTESTTTTTTVAPDVFTGAVVVVANANGVDGSAGQMSRALEAAGFELGTAVNADGETGQLDASVIYYDPSVDAAQAVAETLARLTGGDASIAPVPDPIPTSDGTLEGDVLFMLGNDKAGMTLDELTAASAGDGDEGGPTQTSPEVSGGDVDPDDPNGADPDDPNDDATE